MSKKHLLPDENEEFLERLGLTDIDKRVYIAALDGGLVSAGEIQQLTDINDLGKILQSVRDLIDVGLIKKAQGMMPRYYATLPFFRETLSVEREFKFALEAMLQSLTQAKESTTKNRELIMASRFPKIVDDLLDRYYKEIISPLLTELEEVKDDIKDHLLPFIKEVDIENQSIKEEISLMLKPLLDYTKLLNQQFNLGLTREGEELDQYVSRRKQDRLATLQAAHGTIGKQLEQLKTEISNLTQELRSMHLALREQLDRMTASTQTLTQSISQAQEAAAAISDAKKELQAELVVAREQVKRIVNSGDPDGERQVDQIFTDLTAKIKAVQLSPDALVSSLDSTQATVSSAYTGMDTVVSGLDQTISAIGSKMSTYFDELKSGMTQAFNQLSEQDEAALAKFKEQLDTALTQLQSGILKQGEDVIQRIQSHLATISSQQDVTLNRWQEKMVTLFDRPVEVINPFLTSWLDKIEPIIDDFKSQSDEALADILEPILELETGTFSTLTERIGFVKAMIEGRSNDIQQVLDFAKNFDFTKTSDTWVVVGLPAIYASLTDLLLRSKTRVTVITPHLDLELVEVARTLKSTVRITFVTDIDPEQDARLISKLEEIGRINLRRYPDRDLYACIRDSEEIVFGYIRENEKTVGIRASTPSIVALIEDRFNETVIRNSRPI